MSFLVPDPETMSLFIQKLRHSNAEPSYEKTIHIQVLHQGRRSETPTTDVVRIQVFWGMTPCSLLSFPIFRTSGNINSATECHISLDCTLKADSIRYLPVGQYRHARIFAIGMEARGHVHLQSYCHYKPINVVDR
jgi:hypothetical protein